MVGRCVCGGCSNTRGNHGVTLFKFPQNVNVAKKWHAFVRKTRVWEVGVEHAIATKAEICSDHFTEDCFEKSQLLKFNMGLATT